MLYDLAIRRFLTSEERERRSKPGGGVAAGLAAALLGAEARAASVARPEGRKAVPEEKPATREEGEMVWREEVERRFMGGEDEDFDYEAVDGNEDLDDVEEETRRRQDDYFERMEEEFVGDGEPQGETGVQDF